MKGSSNLMKTLKIGIAGYDQMKARTIAIARGEHKPVKGEPKCGSRRSSASRRYSPGAIGNCWH